MQTSFRKFLLLSQKALYIVTLDIYFLFFRKAERKIRYQQFIKGLELMAEKKYPANPNGFEKLQQAILDGLGPKTSKTTVTFFLFYLT